MSDITEIQIWPGLLYLCPISRFDRPIHFATQPCPYFAPSFYTALNNMHTKIPATIKLLRLFQDNGFKGRVLSSLESLTTASVSPSWFKRQ